MGPSSIPQAAGQLGDPFLGRQQGPCTTGEPAKSAEVRDVLRPTHALTRPAAETGLGYIGLRVSCVVLENKANWSRQGSDLAGSRVAQ